MRKGHLFILSGPSGVGKNVVTKHLRKLRPDLVKIVSYTTRKPRPKEKNKVNYNFVTEKKFKEMIKKRAFIEWAHVHDHMYGTPKKDVQDALDQGHNVLLEIDVQGAEQIKQRMPKAISFFLEPESFDFLKEHIIKRAKMDEKRLRLRLKNAKKELALRDDYDYQVVNRECKADKAAEEIAGIIERIGG